MEQVKTILPKVVEGLAQPMKVSPVNTKVWGKFEDFETFGDLQLEQMKNEAVSFADDLFHSRTPRWLSLLGTSGAGKTMLAKRIAKLFRYHRQGSIDWKRSEATRSESRPNGQIIRWHGGYINWGKAINRMLEGDYAFLSDLREYDFFVLDDIISEYQKLRELSASKLYDVLESRLNKWTIITANVSLKQISETLDPRIASRMIRNNSTVIDIDVPDFNLRARPVPEA